MKNKVLAPTFVVAFIAAVFILPSYTSYGPIDTFPRMYKSAQCSDPSWSTVRTYQKKDYWFAFNSDFFVRVFDSRGNIVHEERLFQKDYWIDSNEIESPAGFCNKTLFSRNISASNG